MLTKEQLDDYCKLLGLSESSADWIKNMRADAPSRAVQGRRRNVTSRYPSRKMGCTIQSESRTNELANIILFENDPGTLEFWDQPSAVKVSYKLESGRNHSHWITPDLFVLENAACGWVECKKVEELAVLAKRSPGLYEQMPDGTWRCPPGEKLAAEYGFFFRVCSRICG